MAAPAEVGINRVELSGQIAEMAAMRYTPAGLPAQDLLIEHRSQVLEAGSRREVALRLRAVAFGTEAERLARRPLGTAGRFSGFLAPARGGKHPVLHIHDFQQV